MASGSEDYTIRIWDTFRGTSFIVLAGHISRVTCLIVLPDNGFLVSGSGDNTIIFWNVTNGTSIKTLKDDHNDPISSLIFLTDGSLVTGYHDLTIRTNLNKELFN